MNKPAPKEPSMDEILSSIRQIIADDDASVAPAPAPIKPAAVAPAMPPAAKPVVPPAPAPRATAPAPAAPLALSPTQMISPAARPAEAAPAADFSAMLAGLDESEPEVSDPDRKSVV